MSFKKLSIAVTFILLSTSLAHADLGLYLDNLNVSARADFGDFRAQVGAHFGVGDRDLDLVFQGVSNPGDAVICLWLGQQSHRPYEVVMREYRTQKGKGWGALAQSLGIKPGSAQFKALKRGDLGWAPAKRSDHAKQDHDAPVKNKGKGDKDHSKGNGKNH